MDISLKPTYALPEGVATAVVRGPTEVVLQVHPDAEATDVCDAVNALIKAERPAWVYTGGIFRPRLADGAA